MIQPSLFLIITAAYLLAAGDSAGSVYVDIFTLNLPSGAGLVVSIADLFTVFSIAVLFASIFGAPSRLSLLLYIVASVANAGLLISLNSVSTAAFAMITIMAFLALFIQLVKM